MRALFLNENIGGHRTVHLHVERALEGSGVDARFVHIPSPGLCRRVVGAGVPGLGRLDLDLQPLRAQLALSAIARRQILRLDGWFDVLHVYTQNAALLSTGLLRHHPTVVSLDTTNALNAYRLPYRSPTRWTPLALRATVPIERRVYRAATLMVAQSEYAAASLRSDYGVPDNKLRVIPLGIGLPDGPPARPGAAGLPRIVFVGTTMERKGGNRLLEVFGAHLRERATLALVTREDVAPRPGVEVISDVTAGDGRIWPILRSAAIFAFPSTIDQAPNAVLEAMAVGLPVVAVRTGAIAEMVEDGVSGILIHLEDEGRALLRALTTLLDDPALRARMGAAALKRARERFDARRTTAALVETLEEAHSLRPYSTI
ncbi:MAG TPA: glycosyltransferase family 4 protein [Acidimicrobiales bacterium]|nr:glycosyltransferase family 4 protein [Acidimicrobiales bacterium]